MSSQDSNKKRGDQLMVGDIVIGVNESVWDTEYEIVQVKQGCPGGSGSLNFQLSIVKSPRHKMGSVYPWNIFPETTVLVKFLEIPYDPNGEGETEDDI